MCGMELCGRGYPVSSGPADEEATMTGPDRIRTTDPLVEDPVAPLRAEPTPPGPGAAALGGPAGSKPWSARRSNGART